MLSFVVNLHGREGSRGESAARSLTVEARLAAVCVQVSAQVKHVLAPANAKMMILVKTRQQKSAASAAASADVIPVLAELAAVRLLVAVAELDVVS